MKSGFLVPFLLPYDEVTNVMSNISGHNRLPLSKRNDRISVLNGITVSLVPQSVEDP